MLVLAPKVAKSVPTAKRDTRILVRYAVAHLQVATLAKRLMRLPRKQKVVSSNLTGGCYFFRLQRCKIYFLRRRQKRKGPRGN